MVAKKTSKRETVHWPLIGAFGLTSIVSAAFFLGGAIKGGSFYYWFLLWNLGLALVAPLAAWWLTYRLKTTPWISVTNIIITLIWLVFLPNSFYIITDLIHVQEYVPIDLLYNIVLIMSCILNALIAGYLSIYLIHIELLKRIKRNHAHIIITIIFLLCGFAIYMGRYLRWSSWDIVINPAGILFDLSDSIISPQTHPELFITTITFFALLGSVYILIWQFTKLLNASKS